MSNIHDLYHQLLEPTPPAERLGRIHFVGIGGVGMAPVARAALERGLPISGSDIKRTAVIEELERDGAVVTIGQRPENLDGVDTVVVTTGLRGDNIEVLTAKERGLTVVHRATMLASLMVGRTAVLIAGTHGKTTTTSMIAVALTELGQDPSYVIGGEIGATGISGRSGKGEVFVAEADESDGTFLHYCPDIAVITNAELDHPDYFASVDAVHEAFKRFVERIKPGGTLVACRDDAGARIAIEHARTLGLAVTTYGVAEDADVAVTETRLRPDGAHARFVTAGGSVEVELKLTGRHNVENAAAAWAVLASLVEPDEAARALAHFTGARRRMELKGEAAGVRVYDDYMHHPKEITATLAAYRELAHGGRLIVAFQAQRYSRAQTFLREYGAPLGAADHVVVLEVYPGSGEDPIPGVTGSVIAGDVPLPAGQVAFEPETAAVPALLADLVEPGDVVVTAGAGDVTTVGPALLELLRRRAVQVIG
ncbi:UDP-N-acetylmuramate--L-alanine ligase [Actinospica durhamensis]|uniref:UDP-N-acetylmuramate--L-alanine ligase n=1 Tax=Actinospica durhamensis TaxID=1508375 RepID=A0A941INP4_9ACTN|nr:UDP-N-acetylmuramate--L-alanine ligase [Actinospica durhamensis]MBR7835635.1 UDP-N-acetylmuramate--L-alanine ligase [Actinospica durhamensis]